MVFKKVALLLMLAISVIAKKEDVGQIKLRKMEKLRDHSPSGLIEFTATEYEELVIQNPRPYNIVNVFTVKSGCTECQELVVEMQGTAYSYDQAKDSLDVPTFFGIIYYGNAKDVKAIFNQHGFKTIPYVATSEMQLKREGGFYKTEDLWLVKPDAAYETQQLLDHINKRFVNDVQIQFPFHVVLIKNLVLFVVLVVAMRVFIYIQDMLINPYLWIAIAWLGYFICTSGVVYTMLNHVPMFKMENDQYGKPYVSEFFMRSNRGQYGGEGYITAAMALCISGAFLVMIKADRIFKTDLQRRIGIGCAIVVAFVGVQAYLFVYRIKTPWYSNDFWPPENYQRGPITRDQGNNI